MRREQIRILVSRLLNGKTSVSSLDQIFLWLRTRSFGIRLIKEIGDFVAHSDERGAGETWLHVRDVVAGFRYAMHAQVPISRSLFVAFLEGAMRLEDPAVVRRELKMGQRSAHKALKSALPKLIGIENGSIHSTGDLTDSEERVLVYYTQHHYNGPAFTGTDLVEGFIDALRGNGLLSQTDEADIRLQADFIKLYVAVKMHMCKLLHPDFANVLLKVDPCLSGSIAVTARCAHTTDSGTFFTVHQVFDTGCSVAQFSNWQDGQTAYWDFPLEFSDDCMVIALVE